MSFLLFHKSTIRSTNMKLYKDWSWTTIYRLGESITQNLVSCSCIRWKYFSAYSNCPLCILVLLCYPLICWHCLKTCLNSNPPSLKNEFNLSAYAIWDRHNMATKSHRRQNTIPDIFRKKCLIEITKYIITIWSYKRKKLKEMPLLIWC